MFGLRKGMVCALLLNVVASRAQATKRAYRSVKTLKMAKTKKAKNAQKVTKRKGKKIRTGNASLASPDVPGDFDLCLPFPYSVHRYTLIIFLCETTSAWQPKH